MMVRVFWRRTLSAEREAIAMIRRAQIKLVNGSQVKSPVVGPIIRRGQLQLIRGGKAYDDDQG